MINPQKAVEWYKQNYKHGAIGLSDYEIYEMLKQDYTQYEYPENPFKQKTQSLGRPRTPQDVEEETEQGYLGKLSLMSLPELWADDHEWAARAYNNSLAGTIYQIANGKPKYQVEGESSGVAEDIGAFFLGLASPIDIFTFLGSGAVGGYTAAKTIGTTGLKTVAGKVLKDNMAKEITEQAALRTASQSGINKFLGKHFSKKGAMESGVSLATYGTAAGALQNAAMQRNQIFDPTHERESFDVWENTWEATKHGLWSGATGAAGGFITKGKMMPKFAEAKLATDATWQTAARRMAYGNFSQINAEAAVFTGGHLAQMAIAGEDIDLDTVVGSYFTNLGIIGGLKTGMSLMKKSGGDVKQYNDLKKNLYEDLNKRQKMLNFKQPYVGSEKIAMGAIGGRKGVLEADMLEIMQLFEAEKIARKGGDTKTADTIAETISKKENNITEQIEAAGLASEKAKRYEKLLEKLENEALDKWKPEEKTELLQLTGEIYLLNASNKRAMLENPELLYQQGAKLFNKKPSELTAEQKAELVSINQKELDSLIEFGKSINDVSKLTNPQEQNKAFIKAFELKEIKKENGNYDVEIFSPEGKKFKTPDFLKNVSKDKLNERKKFYTEEILDTAVNGEAAKIVANPDAPRTYTRYLGDAPLIGENKKPITVRMTPSEAAAEIAAGRPVRETLQDGHNINDTSKSVNQNSSSLQKTIVEYGEKILKGQKKSEPIENTTLDIRQDKADKKQVNLDNVISSPKDKLGDADLRAKTLFETGSSTSKNPSTIKGKETYKVTAGSLMSYIKNSKGVERLILWDAVHYNLNNKAPSTIKAHFGTWANFLEHLRTKNLTLDKITEKDLIDFYDFSLNSKKDGGKGITLTPVFNSGLAQIFTVLKDYGWITNDTYNIFNRHVKDKFAYLNETQVAKRKPPKQGVRKASIQAAKNLSTKKGDDSYIHTAILSSILGIRLQEMPNIKSSLIVQEKGNYILNMPFELDFSGKKVIKYKTQPRKLLLPSEEYALKLKSHLEAVEANNNNLTSGINGKLNTTKELAKYLPSENERPFFDLRERLVAKTSEFWASKDVVDAAKFMFGHDKARIERFYINPSIEKIVRDQQLIHRNLNTKELLELANFTSKDSMQFLRSVERGAPESVQNVRLKLFQEKYPQFGIKIVDSFEKYGVPKDVVGFIQDNNIRILKNKAPSWAIPHEVAHGVFNILRAFRDLTEKNGLPNKFNSKAYKKSIKLINEAERIFKENGKFSEEYAVSTIDKVIDKMIDNPLATKTKGWLKRFNMFIKDIFGIKYNKEEVAWALGEKILSNKGIPRTDLSLSERMKYLTMKDFASPQDYVKAVKLDFNTIAEKFGMTGEKAEKGLKRIIVQAANFTKKGKFLESNKISEKDFDIALKKNYTAESLENLERFHAAMKTLNLDKLSKKRSMLKWIGEYREVENIRVYQKNITEAKQKEMLEFIGVAEGNINNASLKELQMYKKHLNMLVDVERKRVNWFEDNDMQKFLDTDTQSAIKKYLEEGVRFAAPVHEALRNMGLKAIADKLVTHESVMSKYIGQYLEFEKQAERAVGVNNFHGKIKKRGIRDDLWVLDNNGEILLEDIYMWKNKVSAKERKRIQSGEDFFRKAVNDKWWTTVKDNKKGDNLKKIVNGEYIYLRKGSDGKLTPEAIVVKENIKLMEWFASELKEAVKFNLNEAAYEKWLSDTDLRMMENGTYMTRAFTKKAKELHTTNDAYMQKVLKDLQGKFAVQLAEKKYGKNYTTENLTTEAIQKQAKGLAAQTFLNMQTYSVSKFGAKNLKTRMPKRENYKLNEDTGKYDRIYERDYIDLTKSYVFGMSRFLANLKIFPELTSLDGFQITGVKEQLAALTGLSGQMAQKGQWVKKVIEKQVGLGDYDAPFELSFKALETYTRTLAKIGLSFPTSGVKNVLVGTAQTAFAYDVADIGKSLADIIKRDSDLMMKVRKTGATETGMRIYEGTRLEQLLDKVSFDFSFMKPSEKFNRYFNVLAGKHDQVKLIEYMRTYPESHKLHKKALIRLREFYQLNEQDISMLKKYGNIENVKGSKTKDLYVKNNLINQFKMIEQKMNHAAHVNTQGSSSDIYMPSWAGNRGIRPLTLYKRMAYAATDNTRRSLSVAKSEAKAGNMSGIIKPLMGLTATYLSGRAMIEMYSALFGQEMPEENSGFWRQFATILWKGEFLGILSEFFSPYNNSITEVPINIATPAAKRNIMDTIDLFKGPFEGKAFITGRGQALDTFAKNQFSLYNGIRKVLDNKNNNFKVRSKEFGKMYSQFEKEVYKKPNMEFEKTIRSPHYKYLRNSFMTGTPEEFTKAYFATQIAVAHSFLRENKASTIDEAFLKASRELEKQIKAINPNRASFLKDTKDKRKPIRWMQWLSKHPDAKNIVPELEKLERDYLIKIAKIQKEMPYHARKLKVANMFKQYNWKLPNIK